MKTPRAEALARTFFRLAGSGRLTVVLISCLLPLSAVTGHLKTSQAGSNQYQPLERERMERIQEGWDKRNSPAQKTLKGDSRDRRIRFALPLLGWAAVQNAPAAADPPSGSGVSPPALEPSAAPAAITSPSPAVLELPAVVVDAPKANPTRSDVLTKAGLSDYFLKKYPGASRKGQDPTEHAKVRTPNYALAMYRDDERLSRLDSLVRLETVIKVSGDGKGAKALKSERDRAFVRRPTPLDEAMDRSVNPWRRK